MALEMETIVLTFDVDAELEGKLQKLQAEGWGIVPGVKPTTTYTLCRAKNAGNVTGGVATLIVDDAGVSIMPASAHKKAH